MSVENQYVKPVNTECGCLPADFHEMKPNVWCCFWCKSAFSLIGPTTRVPFSVGEVFDPEPIPLSFGKL